MVDFVSVDNRGTVLLFAVEDVSLGLSVSDADDETKTEDRYSVCDKTRG